MLPLAKNAPPRGYRFESASRRNSLPYVGDPNAAPHVVQESVIRGEQFDSGAIFADDAVEEQLGFAAQPARNDSSNTSENGSPAERIQIAKL